VKGVMLTYRRDLNIVDVTHTVAPQAIREAVFLTAQAWPYFPAGTVHLAVIDPGVGTERRAVAVRTPGGFAVGPDNGVLTAALSVGASLTPADAASAEAIAIGVPEGYEVREIASPDLIRADLSSTFHGRDLFGPCAAALASGFPFEKVGPRCDKIVVLPPPQARVTPAGVEGLVVHVDRFGNLITSVRVHEIPEGATRVLVLERSVPIVRTYGDGAGLISLIGSAGYLEIAVRDGSAAVALRAGLDTPVRVPRP
jgi:S-adenosylmethionine hydrolase